MAMRPKAGTKPAKVVVIGDIISIGQRRVEHQP